MKAMKENIFDYSYPCKDDNVKHMDDKSTKNFTRMEKNSLGLAEQLVLSYEGNALIQLLLSWLKTSSRPWLTTSPKPWLTTW